MKSSVFHFIFLLFSCAVVGQTEPACERLECGTDIVNLSTGYDHTTGSTYPAGSYDAFWTLCETPDTSISVPRPAYVVSPNPAWDIVPNTAYISAFPNAALNANNPEPAAPYGFKTCFCVCDQTEVTIDLSAHADNNLSVYLTDDGGGFIQSLLDITSTTTTAFMDPPEMATHTLLLEPGDYCVRADLRNLSGVAMGMDIECTITGASLIESLCCQPNGSITGIKYFDVNCNGERDGNEIGLSGWEIVLCDSTGLPITSVFTDAAGYYSFLDVPPGNYLVKENQQPGWTVSDPISGYHSVTVAQAQVIGDLDFGNCESDSSCDVLACQSDQIIINTGYDPVSGSVGTTGSYDAYWTVCETPDPSISVPRPAYLVNPNPAWANQANTAWISPYPNSSLNANNPAPAPPYGIKYCFCVCDEADVVIDLSALADNNVDINLIEKTSGSLVSPLLSITSTNTSAFTTPTTSTTPLVLPEGEYCIKADLRNLSGVAMGLNIMGTISGGNLLESICCDNTGSITGIKYHDQDCDGVRDPGEPGLPNWEINLCDATGTPITSILTDAAGYYTFAGLAPGTYLVKETQQAGWSQTQPAGGADYTIGLSAKEIEANIDFGNCEISCGPCPNSIVSNGGFENGAVPGNLGGPGASTNWSSNTGTPQIITDDFCGDPASARMWGNQDVVESIVQTGVNFEMGKTYSISFCAKFFKAQDRPTNYVRFGFTASNGFVDPGASTMAYNIGNTGQVTSESWACYSLSNWTASMDFSDLTINCFNDNPDVPGDATTISWGYIDNICITEVGVDCQAAWDYELGDCGEVSFFDASIGTPLFTYCWDFDNDGICDSNIPFPTYTFPGPGTYTVCLTITDSDGCSDQLCQMVTVNFDQSPPTIVCPPDITVNCDESPEPGEPLATNSPCAEELVVECVRSDGQPLPAPYPACETVTITCTATNEFGSVSCDYDITTVDLQPPVAVCAGGVTVFLDGDCQGSLLPSDIDNGSSDNCGIVSMSLSQDTFGPNEACQDVLITLTVTDCGGNTDQCTTGIAVIDNTPPMIVCSPVTIQVDCGTQLAPSVTGFPLFGDNCDGNMIATYSDNVNGVLPCDAVVSRTWSVTDFCGNTSSCVQTILVADQEAPTITCPPDVTITEDSDPNPPSTGDASADDNCDIAPIITHSDVILGNDPCPLTITRTWRAADECGNFAECTQIITVECDGGGCGCPDPTVTGIELVDNGDFSAGLTGFTSDYSLLTTICQPGRYNVADASTVIPMCNNWTGLDHTTASPTGLFFVCDGSQTIGQAAWRQQVNIFPNTNYNLCAFTNNLNEPTFDRADPVVEAWLVDGLGNQTMLATATPTENPDVWVQMTANWLSPSSPNNPYQLEFRTSSTAFEGNNFALDDISFRQCGMPVEPCDSLDFSWSYDNSQQWGECCWLVDIDQHFDNNSVKGIHIDNLVNADVAVFDLNGWMANQNFNTVDITFPGGGPIPQGTYNDQFTVCFANISALPQSLDISWSLVDPSNPDSCILDCTETIFSDCPAECTCEGFFGITLEKGNESWPIACGGNAPDIGCPVNDLTVSGAFGCIGNCEPTGGIDWILTKPDGSTLSGTFAGTPWSTTFATNDVSQAGVYSLSLSGTCGTETCDCTLNWIQPNCPPCVYDQSNLVQNGDFSNGQPTGGDEDIDHAAFWDGIWSNGESTADLYNAVAPTPPSSLNTPMPASQGNFAGFWNRLQGNDETWREGIMNELTQTINPGSGCYDIELKLACLFEPPFGATGLCIYGVNAPGGLASGSITNGNTPDNLNIFPAGNTVELASYVIPASCDENFQVLTFQFDSSDPAFPATGIDHIFITRCDGMNGGEYVAVDDVCLTPGECPPGCCDDFDVFVQNVEQAIDFNYEGDSCVATIDISGLPDCDEISSIDWGDGTITPGPIPNGSSLSHSYTGNSVYTIKILAIEIDDAGQICFEHIFEFTIDSDCMVGSASVAHLETEVSLYPNPTSGNLTLAFSERTTDALDLEVVDMMGRTLDIHNLPKGISQYQLEVDKLPAAVYFIRLTDGKGRTWHERFVKQ